jgi:hypothetical protein
VSYFFARTCWVAQLLFDVPSKAFKEPLDLSCAIHQDFLLLTTGLTATGLRVVPDSLFQISNGALDLCLLLARQLFEGFGAALMRSLSVIRHAGG